MGSSGLIKTLLVFCNVLVFSKAEEGYCTAGNGGDESSCGSPSKIDLYHVTGSPPCLSVQLAAKAVGVDLNLKWTDLSTGQHLTPEFLKMNPQHTVPTINDNGFALTESRAIMGYLVGQYAKDDSLYPKNPKKRALVDQRLYFDIGILYKNILDYYFQGTDEAHKKKVEDALEILDKFLEGREWLAGDSITIADISLTTSVAVADILGYDLKKFTNVVEWFENCKKSIPEYEEISQESLTALKKYVDNSKLS